MTIEELDRLPHLQSATVGQQTVHANPGSNANAARLDSNLAIVFWALCGVLTPTVPSSAQPGLNLSGASNCSIADFDTNLKFLNGPGDLFSILIDKRNISSHPCVLNRPDSPSLMPDRATGGKPFVVCYYCDERLPNGQFTVIPSITVNPGQIASEAFRWKTVPTIPDIQCMQLQAISGAVLVAAPSLLKKVCSDVDVSRFRLGPSPESADGQGQNQAAAAPAFRLTSPRNRYNLGESFSVLLTPIRPSAAATPQADHCPTFYLRERSPDGVTRIDEVQPISSVGCPTFIPGRRNIGSPTSFEIDSGSGSHWAGIGEHSLEVLQLVGSPNDLQIQFISSNILRFQVADPVAMQRKWGPRLKGIAADITTDKETFRVGEDVPLHIAVADFGAPVTIYSIDPVWDLGTVTVQVLDAAGQLLPTNERFPDQSLRTGHGFGPRPMEKGKLIPIESTLAAEGWLPVHPGTYIVQVTWAPCTGEGAGSKSNLATMGRPELKPYAVVHATATIHIVGDAKSP